MQINITLFVQMVQFLTAYWFLHRYIFVPAYNIMHREDQRIQALEEHIVSVQHSMTDRTNQNKQAWQTIQKTLLSSVDQHKNNNTKSVDLENLDFETVECELQDQQIKEGIEFLQSRMVKTRRVKQ